MALDNFVPRNAMVECNSCRKFRRATITCEVYQKWIPREKPVEKPGNICRYYEPEEQKG